MILYSTNTPNSFVSLEYAVLKGLPDDNGLFMPANLPMLSNDFINSLASYSFQEIAFEICTQLIDKEIPLPIIKSIVEKSINFPAPLVALDKQTHVLELFHGPSLAFKDFGARFMAQLMAYFNRNSDKELTILVATSGDTGGAVAAGFLNTPGINVIILYPSGKVSELQEKQLTTLGNNILAIEVQGNFDDCQTMVKAAFLDLDLNKKLRLSSANSINIARLIPQSFYYFEAFKQLNDYTSSITFSVPSGNFGNLTAGVLASKMGLPVSQFIAATNKNDIVPKYLQTSSFEPKASLPTISNAMDVGNPSNFVRLLDVFGPSDDCSTWNNMKQMISGYAFDDKATIEGITSVFWNYGYMLDPHASVGYLAFKKYLDQKPNSRGIILETAHPSKFIEVLPPSLHSSVKIPKRLADLKFKKKESVLMKADFQLLKSFLLQ